MAQYYLLPHPPIMVPSVGKGREQEIKRTIDACYQVKEEIEAHRTETLIVITPHGPIFSDAVAIVTERELSGDLSKFGVYEDALTYEVDLELTDAIIEKITAQNLPLVELTQLDAINYQVELELDHGAYVPLHYVSHPNLHKIVHLTYGMISPLQLYEIGMCIQKAIDGSNKNVAVIASGDLSHCLTKDGPYPYHPSGPMFDKVLLDLLKRGAFDELFKLSPQFIKEACECGLRSLYLLAGCMDGATVYGNVLSYEGPFGVGYGVVNFKCEKGDSLFDKIVLAREETHRYRQEFGNPYTRLARRNLESFYTDGRELEVTEDMPKALLNKKKGVFVSLKKNGDLRGCIGTFLPTTSCVAEEIIHNSLSAALNDPRFTAVLKDELPDLDISVDLLEKPMVCGKTDLDPNRYGVIVSLGHRKGLLLPMLEGVDTVEEQLSIALQKGGIAEDEPFVIERFEVTRYSEEDDHE
ncbi:MAG: AmmeMemoRadiSam system protein A [Turicibacter sp.]